MSKVIRLTEEDLNKLVKRIVEEAEIEEGPLDAIGDLYRGVKGLKRGYGMDYFENMSRLERLIRKLKKLDEPNVAVMTELASLKTKVSNLNMPQQRKQAIMNLIDYSIVLSVAINRLSNKYSKSYLNRLFSLI